MSDPGILGLGQISACGAGIATLGQALSGEPPEPQWLSTTTGLSRRDFPTLPARVEGLEGLVPARAVRRLDRFTRSFVLAARLAVEDAGLEMPAPERIGVVMGTGHGSMVTSFSQLDGIIDEGDDASSPFKFATAVNNAPASSVSSVLGARGPCLAVTGFTDVVANVLRVAASWLASGAADVVIAGAGDEVHPLVGYGLQLGSGWSADGRIRPLHFDQGTFVPGETFAAMVLGSDARGYARISSVATYHDLVADYVPPPGRHLVLAADGRPETAESYRRIAVRGHTVAAFSPLWGGNPSAPALDLIAACLELRNGMHLGVPDCDGAPDGLTVPRTGLPLGARAVDCVTAHPDGSGFVITVGA